MNPSLKGNSEHLGEIENEFLEGIFCHAKCRHFTESDKLQLEKAFALACEAHATQKRKSNAPYMDHISEVLWDYLRITKKTLVDVEDVIVTILHDVLEDHPEYADKMMEEFGAAIFIRIENVSKPSTKVLKASQRAKIERIFSSQGYTFFTHMLEKFSFHLIHTLGTTTGHAELYNYMTSLAPDFMNDTKNYAFLWKVTLLSEDDFEIKCADRISNLKHLTAVGESYVEKNLFSTKIYLMKAQALGRYDLMRELEVGMDALEMKRDEMHAIQGLA